MLKEKENREFKLKSGKKLKCGDVVYISMHSGENDLIAKARFVSLTKDGNAKLYVIDPKYNLIDIEVRQDRILCSEPAN